jgi:hypothetical protein
VRAKTLVVLAAVGLPTAALPQATAKRLGEIQGWVVDTAGTPLVGAEVRLRGAATSVRTNDRGEFRTGPIVPGEHVLLARMPGFSPDTFPVLLEDGETLDVRIHLRRTVVALPEVAVAETALPVRLDDFERRRQLKNGGQFISRDEIEKHAPLATTDLLRRMQGFKIVNKNGVMTAISTRGPRPSIANPNQPCELAVGVDGSLTPGLALNSVSPQEIHGIEIYTAASVPLQFTGARPNLMCGVIMIWLR